MMKRNPVARRSTKAKEKAEFGAIRMDRCVFEQKTVDLGSAF